MTENSSAGLVMLASDVTVTVTREDQHQFVLARYPVSAGQQRQVAVELGWCTIGAGKYRGQPAIEVRLDGARVGELTHAMSQRYAPFVSHVASRGGRPGCEATIRRGTTGLEIVLRLPRHTAGVTPMGAPYLPPAPRGRSAPPSAPAQRNGASRRPWWIAAAVVAVLFVAALAGNDEDSSPSTTSAADRATSTTSAEPTTTPPTTTTPATTAAPVVPTTAALAPVPAPKPAAPPPPPQPTQPPKAKPKPAAPPATTAPKAAAQCHPNYSGCVPVASDVDCLGGSGNGPAYVAGPIRVTGADVYGLDHDKDGTACE